jgi:hypothetical protein
MMILEFENVFESDLVAALYRALHEAELRKSGLTKRIEDLVREAERDDADTGLQ